MRLLSTLLSLAFLVAICGVWFALWVRYVNPLWDRFCDWRITKAHARYERSLQRLNEKLYGDERK